MIVRLIIKPKFIRKEWRPREGNTRLLTWGALQHCVIINRNLKMLELSKEALAARCFTHFIPSWIFIAKMSWKLMDRLVNRHLQLWLHDRMILYVILSHCHQCGHSGTDYFEWLSSPPQQPEDSWRCWLKSLNLADLCVQCTASSSNFLQSFQAIAHVWHLDDSWCVFLWPSCLSLPFPRMTQFSRPHSCHNQIKHDSSNKTKKRCMENLANLATSMVLIMKIMETCILYV